MKAAAMMEEVMPSEELSKEYVRGVTAHKGIQVIRSSKPKKPAHQAAAPKARAEVNTPRTAVASVGMDHTEVRSFLFN